MRGKGHEEYLALIHDDTGQEARLQAALDVTRAVEGHLTCLDVTVLTPMAGDVYGISGGATLLEIESHSEAANRDRIKARLAKEDVSWEWIEVTDYLEPAIMNAAGLADLIVVNRQVDSWPLPDMRKLAAGLVLRSGKPILAVPEDTRSFDTAGAALVAWDGSPEASSALAAAIPLLTTASAVIVLEVDDGSIKTPAEEAAVYLSRHNIHCRTIRIPAEGEPAAKAILSDANSGKFAYVVMGGFGHSQFIEALFGGVSRTLLAESEIPILMAH